MKAEKLGASLNAADVTPRSRVLFSYRLVLWVGRPLVLVGQ